MKLSWIKLAWIAAICVIITMREGQKRYPDERWKIQNIKEHTEHAREHAENKFMKIIYEETAKGEDDIAHMITRGAMIKYLEG